MIDAAVLSDYQTLTNAVGTCELAGWGQLTMKGRDRATFLHGMCTNDIKSLSPGAGCEAFVTNVQGKIVGHVWIFIREDCFDIVATPGQASELRTHWDRYIIREDVAIADLSADRDLTLLCGPQAPELLQRVGGSSQDWQLYQHRDWQLEDAPEATVSIRCLELAVPVFLISGSSAQQRIARDRLRQAGAPDCRIESWECLRRELGWPYFGRDINSQNLPQEVDRNARAISFTKGCYLGQETVARIDALGHVNWYLRGLHLPAEAISSDDNLAELTADGKSVARLTSRGYSPRLQAELALAYVRRGFHAPGTRLPGPAGSEVLVLELPLQEYGRSS